jgi:hypothetical protein
VCPHYRSVPLLYRTCDDPRSMMLRFSSVLLRVVVLPLLGSDISGIELPQVWLGMWRVKYSEILGVFFVISSWIWN